MPTTERYSSYGCHGTSVGCNEILQTAYCTCKILNMYVENGKEKTTALNVLTESAKIVEERETSTRIVWYTDAFF